MEKSRKYLSHVFYQDIIAQTGVGATSTVPKKVADFGIETRAFEVAFLKRVRIFSNIKVPGAAWAVNINLGLQRESSWLGYGDRKPQRILFSNFYDSDSYAYYSQFQRGPVGLLLWEWDEGFEPVLLDNPYITSWLEVILNAGAFGLYLAWNFEYWKEEVTEAEYRKLKLRYGRLG